MSRTARQIQIREIADQIRRHRHTLEWQQQCYGKVSASNFASALMLISIYDREGIQAEGELMNAPNDYSHLPASRLHIDNEKPKSMNIPSTQ